MNTTNATRAEAGTPITHPAKLLQAWALANSAKDGLFSRSKAVDFLVKTARMTPIRAAAVVHRFSETTDEYGVRKALTGPIKVRRYKQRTRLRLSPVRAELVFFKGLADLKLNVPAVSYTAIRRATKLSPSTILRLLNTYAKKGKSGPRAKWYLQTSADDRAKELGIHLPWMTEWLEPVETTPLSKHSDKRSVAEEDIVRSTTSPEIERVKLDLSLDINDRVLGPMLWLTGVAGGCAVLAVVAAAAAIYGAM